MQILEQGIRYFSDLLVDLLAFKSGSKNPYDVVRDDSMTLLARPLTYSRNFFNILKEFVQISAQMPQISIDQSSIY